MLFRLSILFRNFATILIQSILSMLRNRMNILSITTSIQSNKRSEVVLSVHISRIEPRIAVNTFQRT